MSNKDKKVKKAQLVLIGGRSSIPNILPILHLQPEVVVALCSKESYQDFPKFKRLVETFLPGCYIVVLPPVDAFAPKEIAKRCEEAFQRYPKAEWICNITSATSIMSIAVYEQSKRSHQTCWYIHTSNSRVIKLAGKKCQKDIFHLTVPQYVAANYYSLEDGDMEKRRDLSEQQWLPFARMLGKNPRLATHLKHLLDPHVVTSPKKGATKTCTLANLSEETYALAKEAEKCGLFYAVTGDAHALQLQFDYIQFSFLNGGWLEAYVWDEVKTSRLFDDCQWNHKIAFEKVQRELDVIMTYKAQLIVAECKTGKEAIDKNTLNDILSLVGPLGARFVGKIIISPYFVPDGRDREKLKAYDDFLEKADQQHIVVIGAEELPHVRERLEDEAKNPRYARI